MLKVVTSLRSNQSDSARKRTLVSIAVLACVIALAWYYGMKAARSHKFGTSFKLWAGVNVYPVLSDAVVDK